MEEDIFKEVYFDEYCETCMHKDLAESKEPCYSCLAKPENLYSHKPVKYVKKEK